MNYFERILESHLYVLRCVFHYVFSIGELLHFLLRGKPVYKTMSGRRLSQVGQTQSSPFFHLRKHIVS